MFKKLGLSTMLLSALLLNSCGGGGSSKSDPMNDKKYVIIYTEVAAGVCESNEFRDFLTAEGFQDFLTRETDNTSSCQTYGKQNDNRECAMQYVGSGDKNCVIGFNAFRGNGSLPLQQENTFDIMETLSNK